MGEGGEGRGNGKSRGKEGRVKAVGKEGERERG